MTVLEMVLNIIFSLVIMEVIVIIARRWLCFSFQGAALVFDTKITFLGVIHHELSHALFAALTGAKIKKIVLFKKNIDSDNSLGYVEILFSNNRFISSIQRFFTAIAPLITACITSSFLANLLLRAYFTGEVNGIMLISQWQFWIFILLATPILYHATMSKSDMIECLKGSWFIILIIFFIAMFFPQVLVIINTYITSIRNFTFILMLIPFILGMIIRIMS